MSTESQDTVRFTIKARRDYRLRLGEAALRRARKHGGLPPPVQDLLDEAIELFLLREERGT